MSATTAVWWATLVALVVVLGLAAWRARQAIAEVRTIERRLGAFAQLPVVAALAKAERDVKRLQALGDAFPLMAARAQHALATIRQGPVTPELRAAALQVVLEAQELHSFVPRGV